MTKKQATDENENENENPKTAGGDASNRIKDPSEWTTGDEPMTGAQASYLKTLSEEAKSPDAFEPDLDKAEASKRIDALRKEAGRG
ncbi:DUF3072 domain-containing protein [Methylobacterium sp. Leaf106]|uniref:DUF3072 domain-containing protein n=1 Tax=Methylobacterium sp. Leaf106 TaxID=1736255 RepID=UPI0006F33F0B|nr:DUF3072 domain-containing protein [Methylobacterium sp. Leaf106]KQP41921.1 hypothetical protein ASF34_09340 [Methylobacterium sp. Leaf106]